MAPLGLCAKKSLKAKESMKSKSEGVGMKDEG
jgi:hypothetical protein